MIEKACRIVGGLLLGAIVLLGIAAALTPLPASLREDGRYGPSTRFVDRNGDLLREVRGDDHTRAVWTPLDEIGERPAAAMIAAEDRRFREHVGVDPEALVRAAFGDLRARRVVSGASTLTMQLARLAEPHPRTLLGKLREMAVAVRIEWSLDKRAILEQYLNRAPFGDNLRGIGAASRFWFDKPPRDLSLAEAATLAAMPRGPHYYAIDKHPDRVKARRDRILARMVRSGAITEDARARAASEPITLQKARGSFGAPHLVASLMQDRADAAVVETTIDRNLQREAELAAVAVLAPLATRHVTAASVLVVDNRSGDVLAYVGSPRWDDDAHLGKNDGVRALRQPGSALKPFVYAVAMDDLGWTPATLLPDVELHVDTPNGTWSPKNYDERYHGPVLLRTALGSSVNVPAVFTANELGDGRVLARLRELGFALDGDAEKFGAAIALGDGEVRLWDLARAYSMLARGGLDRPLRTRRSDPAGEPKRVVSEDAASMLTDVLRDRSARVAAFGRTSPLDLAYDVAAKTGTSKGYRDNWTVGYTREVTVAVWTGNFDGSPMLDVSGITGAAPLFAEVMNAAMRDVPSPASLEPSGTTVEICALSGGAPGPGCKHRVSEHLPSGTVLGPCSMHEVVAIDSRNGKRAGPACPPSVVASRSFERFDGPFEAWARAAGRTGAPDESSPLCPGPGGSPHGPVTIRYPRDGAHFVLDPDRTLESQQIPVKVDGAASVFVDGRLAGRTTRGEPLWWRLARGSHSIVAEADGVSSQVEIRVE